MKNDNKKKRSQLYSKWVALGMLGSSLLGVSGLAHAGNSFSTNNFKPVTDDSAYFTMYDSLTMRQKKFHIGTYLNYAFHPYEVSRVGTFGRVSGVTDHLLVMDLLGSVGITDWLNVGGRLPIVLWNNIDAPALGRLNENNFNLGDFELNAKVRLLNREDYPVGISLVPFISFPTATDAIRDVIGNSHVTGGAKVVIDGQPHERVNLALNLGYEARKKLIDLGGNRIDDYFLMGLGVGVDVLKDKLRVIGEVDARTVAGDFFKRRTTPVETRLGFRYMFSNGIDINAGGGLGISNGIPSPDFRLFAGVTYTKRPPAKVSVKEEDNEVKVGDEINLGDKIYFEFDKAVVRSISKPTLDKAAAVIKAHPEITRLRIEGHTCDLGSNPYNQKLSDRRAKAVVDYLVSQGVSRSILNPIGYGETKPAVPNTNESNREQNRRVQFFVEEKK